MNISCDVMSNPPATMLWRRERLTISAEGTANTRVHSASGKSVLEVGTSRELRMTSWCQIPDLVAVLAGEKNKTETNCD